MAYKCPMCECEYVHRRHLLRHIENAHAKLWTCIRCRKQFNREDNYTYHARVCEFHATGARPESVVQFGGGSDVEKTDNAFELQKTAFDGSSQLFTLSLHDKEQKVGNIHTLLRDSIYSAKDLLSSERENKKAVKFYFSLHLLYHQAIDETLLTEPPIVKNTKPCELYAGDGITGQIHISYDELLKEVEKFETEGSGWVLHKLIKLDLHINQLDPLRASSYIPTPKYVLSKKAVVNVKNEDNSCFLWTYLAAIHANEVAKDPQRVSHYKKYSNELKTDGIEMPMQLRDIRKFERLNNCSVSVYGLEEEFNHAEKVTESYIYPLVVARDMKERHVNMLLITDGDKSHYCWIKNLSRLIGNQYSNYNGELAYCRFCLHGFKGAAITGKCSRLDDAKRRRDEHESECFKHNGQLLVFPKEDIVEFKNVSKQVEAPFCVYADFESVLAKVDDAENDDKKTIKYQEHKACSFAYYIVSRVPGVEFKPKLYFGEDAPEKLLSELKKDYYEKIKPLIDRDIDMVFDDEAKSRFDSAKNCYICSKPLNEDRVRDHDHFTGHFRGAAHSDCNLQYQISKSKYKLPVVFHNLKGYDAHLIMQGVRKKHGSIRVIPTNMERYLSFTIGPLKFLDSHQFLSSSLENLASTLNSDQFIHLKKHLDGIGTRNFILSQTRKRKSTANQSSKKKKARNQFIQEECDATDGSSDEEERMSVYEDEFIDDSRSDFNSISSYHQLQNLDVVANEKPSSLLPESTFNEEKFNLLRKKGIYCYDFFNTEDAFKETKLPPLVAFHNKLRDENITEEEYEHALHVWKIFGCKTLRDYHDIYLLTDVMILTDVFEVFRCMARDTYKLEPLHYYTLPGFSWDAALKYTGVQIELLKDLDMHIMIKKGMRGGISSINHRYAKANHPAVPDYDPNSPHVYLMYLDANGLYAWAMEQLLPLNGFKWVDINKFDLSMLGNGKGYILEIDCEFPEMHHDRLNDYPLAPEKMCVTSDMISPLQQSIMSKNHGHTEKLIPNLNRKSKYVVHHKSLQQYMQNGMKVTKIHRVIEFNEKAWLKPYIELNTNMRKEATMRGDKAGIATFKLMSNAIFGKTCENLEKRVNIELINSNAKILKKRIAKPNFKRTKIFRTDLVGVDMSKTKVVLNRPMQVGFAILEISKTLMYDFHYNKWLPKFPEAKLLFTDTDSLCYKVAQDPVKVMATFSDDFDFSEYPKTHELYEPKNMKVLGKMKDECNGLPLLKFIGLRPKLYAMQKLEMNKNTTKLKIVEDVKGKGLTTSVRRNQLSLADFDKCVSTHQVKSVVQRTIGSDHHNIYSYEMRKIGLSAADDKRWIAEDGISTLSHGHYKIKEVNKKE